jgi:hypothetical protein
MSSPGCHYALEHAPEHVRGYPAVPSFSHGKVKSLEQPVERISPELVGDVCPKPSLQGVRFEEAAVQEWNWAKGYAGSAAILWRAIQSAEEQWAEEVAMDPPVPPKAAVYLFRQEAVPAAQPAFGLDEVQEQDPCELQESQTMAVFGPHRPGKACTQVCESTAELLEESTPNRF